MLTSHCKETKQQHKKIKVDWFGGGGYIYRYTPRRYAPEHFYVSMVLNAPQELGPDSEKFVRWNYANPRKKSRHKKISTKNTTVKNHNKKKLRINCPKLTKNLTIAY